jgi:hypothetical protein
MPGNLRCIVPILVYVMPKRDEPIKMFEMKLTKPIIVNPYVSPYLIYIFSPIFNVGKIYRESNWYNPKTNYLS